MTCLVAGVVLAYWNSLRTPFLFDDTGAIVNNPTIRRLWSIDAFNPPADGSTTTGRPLVNFSYALNYAVSGGRVWSYHALNIALHALAALTLFGLVRQTLRTLNSQPSSLNSATLVAFATALLWALHPLQTETVVGIAQRTESLCGLFYLLTLYAFARAAEPGVASARWLAVSAVSCLAGMGTKEVMVTAPLIVLLYDRTFFAGGFFAALRQRRAYFAALAGTWLLLAWLVLRGGGSRGAAAGFGLGVTWWTYLLKQCEALVLYLKLTVWPHPLVLDYGTAITRSPADVWWQGLVVVALLAATLWALVRKPALGFAGAWFFVVLAPSSSVVPLVTQTMAEHRMYLPLAGIVALIVHAACRRLGPPAAWVLSAAALVLGVATASRNRDYRDAVSIWTDTVDKVPSNARAHNNLAFALHEQGKNVEASAHFVRAVALQPDYVTAHYDWGVALLDQGRAVDAIVQFETAVRLAPDHIDALVNLGNALVKAQRAADAIPRYEQALRLKPAADVHYNLGLVLASLDRLDDAERHFQAALQLAPNLTEARDQLARLAAAHAKLGLQLARAAQLVPAGEHLRAAVRLNPNDADAHANLANMFLLQGRPREAIAEYEVVLRLRPDDARTLENLALARAALR